MLIILSVRASSISSRVYFVAHILIVCCKLILANDSSLFGYNWHSPFPNNVIILSTRLLLCLILKHFFPLESFHWYPYVWRCIPSYVTTLLLCTRIRHRGCSSFFVLFQVKDISESYFPGAWVKPIIQEHFSECIPVIKHHRTFPAAPVSSVDFC